MTLRIELHHHGHLWSVQTEPVDLSVPVNPQSGLPRAWYQGPAKATPVQSDGWIGSVADGGSVNFRNVQFNPHAHGTHTETREHIHDTFEPVDALVRSGAVPFLMPAILIEAQPQPQGEDWVVPLSSLQAVESQIQAHRPLAVVLRCTNGDIQQDWSHTNPPYLQRGFAELLVDHDIKHLLLDLPSVDREVTLGNLRLRRTGVRLAGLLAWLGGPLGLFAPCGFRWRREVA